MRGFAVLGEADKTAILEKYPVAGKIWGIDRLIQPYKQWELEFNGIQCESISIPYGFVKSKLKRAIKNGNYKFGHVFSKDFQINFNPFFYHSCLIRALDFYTVSLGCDMRINEVIIADAATVEGRNAFRLLLPIARRIILVTERKNEIQEEVNFAMRRYGTSVAIIEDPIKATERADVIVLASSNREHIPIANIDRPMLNMNFIQKPKSNYWIDGVDVSFRGGEELGVIYAQGYVDTLKKRPVWINAERDGFLIKNITREKRKIIER